jgi:putative transposase
MADMVKRAFKFRFHPTDEQAGQLARTFGCVRLVYNMALEARAEAWAPERRRISGLEGGRGPNLSALSEILSVCRQ